MKTKRIDKKHRWHNANWSLGAVIVALLGTFLLLVSLLSRPSFDIINHHIVLTQGIVAPAVIMGSVVWSIIEFFTPPGEKISDLFIRIIPAFIIGGLVGGILGYLYDFGDYVLRPAFSGNLSALLFLISILVASLAVLWNAAWSHKHGFRGQKGAHIRKMPAKESGTSKAKRGMLFLLVIIIILLVAAPIGSAIGGLFVSGHDNSNVLKAQSEITYVTSKSGSVPFAFTNNTATFDFPTNETTVYLETNLTLAELNNYAVSHLMVKSSVDDYTLTIGTGNMTDFSPLYSVNSTHAYTNISTPTYRLTGVQPSHIVLKNFKPL